MLQFEKGKKNGGFTLWGTYESLKDLHSFILDLSARSIVLEGEGLTLALAYDIRKAYEGQRESDKTTIWNDELSIYGVEQVWPTFLTQVALLRTGLAFVNSSKLEQSHMYFLEDFTEKAISGSFPKESKIITACFHSLVGLQEKQVADRLGSRVSYFLSQDARKRKSLLGEILWSLDSRWDSRHEILGIDRMDGVLCPNDFTGHSWDTLSDEIGL